RDAHAMRDAARAQEIRRGHAELQRVEAEDVRRHVVEVRLLLLEQVLAERRGEPVLQRIGRHESILIDSAPMVQIHAVPAFRDNYIWLLEDGRNAAAVDPGDARPVEDFLQRRGLTLAAVIA